MADRQNLMVFHNHRQRGGVRTALLRRLQCLAHAYVFDPFRPGGSFPLGSFDEKISWKPCS